LHESLQDTADAQSGPHVVVQSSLHLDSMDTPPLPQVFIGSSAEGREIARNLQAELGDSCHVVRWDQSVFEPSDYALDSLIATAHSVDFAVLIATPDDTTKSRGTTTASVRDNIVLEFGLFAGALGRARTFLLATGDLKLPTDILGLTRLPYRTRPDGNIRAAVNDAAVAIENQMRKLGRLRPSGAPAPASLAGALDAEIQQVCDNAVAQGWTVRTNSPTTLRLRSPRGVTCTLSRSRPEATRVELREFVKQLRSLGLRVNSSVRRPPGESPL